MSPTSRRGGAVPTGAPEHLHDLCDDTVGCMSRLHRLYGPIVAYPKGSDLTVFAFGPEANESVYGDPATFHIYGPPGPKNSAQRRFGLGLFGLNGPKQQQHRRLFLPALRKPAVEASAPVMREQIEEFLAGWRIGQTLDLYGSTKDLSLRIAGKLLFGLRDLSAARAVAAAFQDWLDDYIRVLFALTLPVDLPPGRYQDWLAAGQRLEGDLRDLLRQRREIYADGQGDLLALLLRAERAATITEAEVIGEMQTLLNASYQTTATALTWTLLLLAQHPDVLRAVLDEQQRARGTPLRPGQTTLLERVIRESMRILPPVVFTARRAIRPADVAGHAVPAGTIVLISMYETHHQERTYPQPERFWPDRWLEQRVSPYAYVAFGAGARMCLGTAFSLQLFQVAIPAIVTRYRLALAPGTRVDRHSSLTMGVDGVLPVTLYARDDRFGAVPLTGNIHEMVELPHGIPETKVA
jgi:cytochrome P450